ncbi:hypothetical protein Rsub_04859 [Raphidocelis subcapitata]|uniref:Corrinoid adenosyltransferase MMAB n=1 Tax=Raphidocelis subcapitata TaxID=307507 RepID=A0A2V0P016_9CHLO|nr:hypothetical protein Rsub_04859 [Raphidocelis subcapitata]|eukprot:GBF91190.1 hypothetical protein Rsub_04859 [Raphidocelis subcapitata]
MAEGEAKFKIYTKTGDAGSAALYTGERRPKEDAVFAALGDVDELNCALGAAREFCAPELHGALAAQLAHLQSRLLDVGSAVATPAGAASERQLARVQFDAAETVRLEAWIDSMDEQLPPLRNFILPSGGRAASLLHLSRAVCRRAERAVAPLARAGEVRPEVGAFLNRLSDYLFQAARWAAMKEGREETVYKKGAAAAAAPPPSVAEEEAAPA